MGHAFPELQSLKTCCEFTAPDLASSRTAQQEFRVFHDPAGLDFATLLATRLGAGGYKVTQAKVAIGVEAGFICRLSRFLRVDIVVGVSTRRETTINAYLEARPWKPIFSKFSLAVRPNKAQNIQQMEALLGCLDFEIKSSLHATSVEWNTAIVGEKSA